MGSGRFNAVFKRSLLYVIHYKSTYKYSKLVNPGSDFTGLMKRRKFEMRVFINLRYHLEMLKLFENSKLSGILSENIRILDKVCRRYIIYGATGKERFHIVRSTYLFVRDKFSPDLIRDVFIRHNFLLCHIDLPIQQKTLFARLAYLPRFEKEGEITLGLFQEDGRRLYSVTFSIRVRDDIPEVIIGCILGPDKVIGNDASDRQLVRDLTKEMHGERPKNLVMFLLQGVCRYFGIQCLSAVAFYSHIYGGDRSRRSRITSDYDEFWQELGGQMMENGTFNIPLLQCRRTYEEIPSKKRAGYARRYAMLDGLEIQIVRSLLEINSN
jgi:uncharacterized protein VirK/YbjX